MNFVADEGVDQQIVTALRKNGHDILYIAELESGITDELVLHYANEQNRILMTRDKDFGELVYRDKKVHSGIILNRLYELNSEKKAELVDFIPFYINNPNIEDSRTKFFRINSSDENNREIWRRINRNVYSYPARKDQN